VVAQSHECESKRPIRPSDEPSSRPLAVPSGIARGCAEERGQQGEMQPASGVAAGPGASFTLVHGLDPGDGNGVTFCH
jgi:hypothetical protein